MSLDTGNVSNKYVLSSVEASSPPEGMLEGNWVRYIVDYGDKKMTCIRAGTLQEVTLYAEEYVEYLNLRTSKGYSAYAPRNIKK